MDQYDQEQRESYNNEEKKEGSCLFHSFTVALPFQWRSHIGK